MFSLLCNMRIIVLPDLPTRKTESNVRARLQLWFLVIWSKIRKRRGKYVSAKEVKNRIHSHWARERVVPNCQEVTIDGGVGQHHSLLCMQGIWWLRGRGCFYAHFQFAHQGQIMSVLSNSGRAAMVDHNGTLCAAIVTHPQKMSLVELVAPFLPCFRLLRSFPRPLFVFVAATTLPRTCRSRRRPLPPQSLQSLMEVVTKVPWPECEHQVSSKCWWTVPRCPDLICITESSSLALHKHCFLLMPQRHSMEKLPFHHHYQKNCIPKWEPSFQFQQVLDV